MLNNDKVKGHILILIANILFGINMPVSKYLMAGQVTPEGLTIMRMLFACVMFWITSLFFKQEKVPFKDLALLFLCAMCGIAINQSVFIEGLSRTSPVDASIIATAGPIYVMLLAAIILKEPITRQKTIGVMVGAAGALTLILFSAQSHTQSSDLTGDLMVFFSGFMYSIYVVVSRPLSQRYSSITIMKWMFLFSCIVLLPVMYKDIAITPAFHTETPNWTVLGGIAFVLLGATYLPYLMIPMALKRLRPTTVSMYNYMQPIVASFIAIMIGQDRFSIGNILSAILVFAGVYLVTQSKSREDLEKEKKSGVL
ncbi:MAG: DMT family transporter [Tannerellaceae bacterium]|nr:DMT family transporter [Tannerellaceae bacterium]